MSGSAQHDAPHLTPLFHLAILQRVVAALLTEAMTDSPLSPLDYAVTSAIEASTAPDRADPDAPSPAGIGTTALAAQFAVPLTTATEWVNRLVIRGILERTPDPHDGRRHVLRLTGEGARATTVAREHFGRGYLAFVDELPIDPSVAASQLETMTAAARAALRRLEGQP